MNNQTTLLIGDMRNNYSKKSHSILCILRHKIEKKPVSFSRKIGGPNGPQEKGARNSKTLII
jgi:hypothetical protein